MSFKPRDFAWDKRKAPPGATGFLTADGQHGGWGLEGPTVRMINAHARRQFRADPADRALVLPHVPEVLCSLRPQLGINWGSMTS